MTIETIAGVLQQRQFGHVVLDPVLICKGQEPGAALDTDQALRAQVLPLATFVTPNHFEALTLSAMERIESVEHLGEAARRIHETSGAAVLAKGGVRLAGPDAVDVFYDGSTTEVLSAPEVGEVAVAGAGCTLAAALAARPALGADPLDAARAAKAFVTADPPPAGLQRAIRRGPPVAPPPLTLPPSLPLPDRTPDMRCFPRPGCRRPRVRSGVWGPREG